MEAVVIVGIVFTSILIAMTIIAGTIVALARGKKGVSFGKAERLQADETRLIQEIHEGLSKMDKRVESLETILLERQRKDDEK